MEEFKSPLPPRRAQPLSLSSEPETSPEPVPQSSFTPPEPLSSVSQKPKNKSNFVPVLIGIVIVCLIIVGFSFIKKLTSGSNKAQPITLEYWGLWEESDVLQSVIDDFQKENPTIKINYKKQNKDNYRSRLQVKLEKGESDAPDIFRIHGSWLPMFKNSLAPIPDAVSTSIGLDSDFYDVYKKDLKLNGKYIGVPLMYDSLMMFYNTKLLESSQKKVPITWWGLKETAVNLTVRDNQGKIRIAGASLGLADNIDHWSDIVGLLLLQNGANLRSTSAENLKTIGDVLTYYTYFAKKYIVWDDTLPESTSMFASGKLGFYFGPSWRVFDIQALNPNLKFNVSKVPQLPTLEGLDPDQVERGEVEANLTNVQWATYWFEGVNKKSTKIDAAWKFLQYISSKENLSKMYKAASQIRKFGEIYPRKSMSGLFESDDYISRFLETAPYAKSSYLSSRTWDNGLNDQMAKYFKDAINSMVSQNQEFTAVQESLKSGMDRTIQLYGI